MDATISQNSASTSASTSTSAGHPGGAAISLFARGVVSLLSVWPALRLALTHGWSKPSSSEFPPETPEERRTRLAEELVDAYYSAYAEKNGQLPEITEIEDFLLDFIEFEYGIALEDGSEVNLAKDLQDMWIECVKRATGQLQLAEGQEGTVEKFERMAQKARNDDADPKRALRATRARNQSGNGQDDDDDDSSSGSEDDVQSHSMDADMDSAPTQRREKEEPIVDEDGFTMVSSKKGRR